MRSCRAEATDVDWGVKRCWKLSTFLLISSGHVFWHLLAPTLRVWAQVWTGAWVSDGGANHDPKTARRTSMPRHLQRLTALKVTNARSPGLRPDEWRPLFAGDEGGLEELDLSIQADGRSHAIRFGPVASVSLAQARDLPAKARRGRVKGKKAR